MTPRIVPWGPEALYPALRAAARLRGADPSGPFLDRGEGSRRRITAAPPDATAWEPEDGPVPPRPVHGLILAWPGPAHLPPEARDAWWTELAANLAPGGVAAVRLDLLPGWHPLTAVQDFARFHGGLHRLPLGEALRQVIALGQLGGLEDDGRWYGWLQVVERLLHEAPDALPDLVRGPLYPAELHAWLGEAARHGLRWLGDAGGPLDAPWTLVPSLAAWVREEVERSGDPVRGAQIADYACDRHARLVLLARAPSGPCAWPEDPHVAPALDRPHRWALAPIPPWEEVLTRSPAPGAAATIAAVTRSVPLTSVGEAAALAGWTLGRLVPTEGPLSEATLARALPEGR